MDTSQVPIEMDTAQEVRALRAQVQAMLVRIAELEEQARNEVRVSVPPSPPVLPGNADHVSGCLFWA
jgi:hypothetical protein